MSNNHNTPKSLLNSQVGDELEISTSECRHLWKGKFHGGTLNLFQDMQEENHIFFSLSNIPCENDMHGEFMASNTNDPMRMVDEIINYITTAYTLTQAFNLKSMLASGKGRIQ